MSGDFVHRHHEIPRLTLCVPTEEVVPIPMKYVDVVGQTRCCRAHSERLLDFTSIENHNCSCSSMWTT